MQLFGDYQVIYAEHEHRYLFGVLIYHDPFTSLTTAVKPEQPTTLQLQSGTTIVFSTNEITVTKDTKKVTTELRPFTTYLLNEDLSMTSSTDVSGIRFEPRQVWIRRRNAEVTRYYLVLPEDFLKRFGRESARPFRPYRLN
jgi:hypothetical protein